MKYTVENFKDGEFAINCKTREEANNLMELLQREGVMWCTNNLLIGFDNWHIYEKQTYYAYDRGLVYGCLPRKSSGKMITFEEFLADNKSNKEKILEIIGVEIGEPFNITGYKYNPYVFDDNYNLIDKDGDKRENLIFDILWEDLKIEKIPEDPNADIKKYIELLSNEEDLDDNVHNGVLVSLKELLVLKEQKTV